MAATPGGRLISRGAGALAALLPLAFFLPLWQVLSQGLQVGGTWTLARVRGLLADPYVQHLILFTLKQALLSAGLSLALGFPLGWLLARYRFPGKELVRAFTLVPFVFPPSPSRWGSSCSSAMPATSIGG